MVRALKIAGSASPNSTSTTVPATCTTLPMFMSSSLLERSTGLAAGDVEQFRGDASLAPRVVFERQVFDQTLRVVGGVLHRHHPRALLARFRVEENEEQRDIQKPGEEGSEKGPPVRLEQALASVRGLQLHARNFQACDFAHGEEAERDWFVG